MPALVVYLLASLYLVCAQNLPRGSPCITPNGESAKCQSFDQCKVLRDAIITRDQEAIKFAQLSQCGYEGTSTPLVCCGTKSVLTTARVNSLSPLLPDSSACGIRDSTDRVLGGERTIIGEHPWVALLHYKRRDNGQDAGFRCGGTLINERYVLTAAHCLEDGIYEVDWVRLGEWQISTEEDCLPGGAAIRTCSDLVVDSTVQETNVHPDFLDRTAQHDIALLRLSKRIGSSRFIRPICLPQPNSSVPVEGTELLVVGWGATENGSSSDFQLKVKVPIFPKDRCSRVFRNSGRALSYQQICAGGIDGKDSCNGDSGGPLLQTIVSGGNQWYQEGIVSWGISCGLRNIPGVYTRVSTYIDWIISNIRQ